MKTTAKEVAKVILQGNPQGGAMMTRWIGMGLILVTLVSGY